MAILTQSRILAFALLAATTLSASSATFKELHPFSRPLQGITVTSADTNGAIYGISEFGGPYGSGASFHLNTTGSLDIDLALQFFETPFRRPGWIQGPDHTFWHLEPAVNYPPYGYGGVLQHIDAQGIFTGIFISDPAISIITFNPKGQLFGLSPGQCINNGQPSENGKLYTIATNGQLTMVTALNSCDQNFSSPPVFMAASDGSFYHFGPGDAPPKYGLFKIATNGTVARMASFDVNEQPLCLVEGPDGIYGTTYSAHPSLQHGSRIFRLSNDGKFSTLTRLPPWLGRNFSSIFFQGKDGFYGTTDKGGLYGNGAIFKIDFTGRLRKTYQLKSPAVISSLTVDAKGVLYGARSFYYSAHGLYSVVPLREEIFSLPFAADGTVRNEPKILHAFAAQPVMAPNSVIRETRNQTFHWAAGDGRSVNKMTKDGLVTTAATLASPYGYLESVFQDSNGTLFGSVFNPSSSNQIPNFVSSLYRQTGNRLSLLDDLGTSSSGQLVGTPLQNPNGQVDATLYSFQDSSTSLVEFTSHGSETLCNAPGTLVARDTNGLFYFASSIGGECGSPLYRGTADGNFTNIACVPLDPNNPQGVAPIVDLSAPFVCGSDGNLYGFYFGDSGYAFFKVTKDGDFVPLASLSLYVPTALVEGPDRNFYGVSYTSGDYDLGTVFRLTPDGTVTILHHFNLLDGANPAGLILTTDKKLLGWTQNGGSQYGGNIFVIEGLFSGAGH